MENPHWASRFRVHRKVAQRYVASRIVLIGDAAHIHSPAGGQGMNTGIQDAANLGWKLALAARAAPERSEELIASYEQERRPVAEAVTKITDLQAKLWMVSPAPVIALRNAILRFASRTGLLERRIVPMLAQSELDYSAGEMALARGGRKLPNAMLLRDSERIDSHDLLDDPRLLLLLDHDRDPAASAELAARVSERWEADVAVYRVSRRPAGSDGLEEPWLQDVQGRLFDGAPEHSALLVRPEGFTFGYDSPELGTPLIKALERWVDTTRTIAPAAQPAPALR